MRATPAQSLAVWPPNKPTMSAPATRSKATRSGGPPPRRPEASASGAQRQLAEAGGAAPWYQPSRQKGGLPRSGDSKSGVTGSAWHTAFDGGTTQHGSGGRTLAAGTGVPEAAGCPNKHLMAEAGHYSTQLTDVHAVLHFAGGDPQSAEFCDGPGPGMALERNSLPAADYDRAGHTENGATKLCRRHLT